MYKITIIIDGMKCGMCEAHVNDIIYKNFEVKKVKSHHNSGVCEIVCDSIITQQELISKIQPTGYKVLSYQLGEYKKKGFFGF